MTFKQFYANKKANRDNLSEGRTQIPMSELVMRINNVTITDFSFGKTKDGAYYCICLCKELPDRYFFASSVLYDSLREFIAECYNNSVSDAKAAVKAEGGWPYSVSSQRSRSGKNYYAWSPIF